MDRISFMPINNTTLAAILLGFLLDCVIGDPQNPYHPIRFLGFLNTMGLKLYRKIKIHSNKIQFLYGMVMTAVIVTVTYFLAMGIIVFFYSLHFAAGFVMEVLLCYFLIAAKALYQESMKVSKKLKEGQTEDARKALSYIVGRDTKNLPEEKIVKAAVETVAENLSDGVVAPLLFLFLGGVPLGFAYKAVNTLDSMIGYKNEDYFYLGKFAARIDDVVNLIPARLSALFMIIAALLTGKDIKNAVKIYKRDRYHHLSPNSAHTEAVCAGALNIELGGSSMYQGKIVEKLTIGDNNRRAVISDILSANQLMYVSGVLALLMGTVIVLC